MKRSAEDLLVGRLLRGQVPLLNAALDAPLSLRLGPDSEERVAMPFDATLRTSGWYLLKDADMPALLNLAQRDEESAEDDPDLPPLPFPRCWFEVWDDQSRAAPIVSYADTEGEEMAVLGFAVIEEFVGLRWRVITCAESAKHLGSIFVVESSILRGDESIQTGRTTVGFRPPTDEAIAAMEEQDRDRVLRAFSLPVYIVHLVTTLDVSHTEIQVPRPERRRWARAFAADHPKVYFVDLARCGDVKTANAAIDSPYRHRWLVRGHYRVHPSGTYELPRGKCVWVRPHAKGPAGAPWKGRPVHRLESAQR